MSLVKKVNECSNEFVELQDRMVAQASIYKGTKLDPFYRFMIGEMDWKDCVEKVSDNLTDEVNL